MSIEIMKQALEALEYIYTETTEDEDELIHAAIASLRLAIEQAEKQEAWTPSDTAYRPGGLPQDFIKHEVDAPSDWSEWVCPDPAQYFIKCCDCGLVHEMQFRVARYSEGDECDLVVDPAIQAQFRMRRIEQAEKQAALNRMADNARELGLNYERMQEPVGFMNAGHVYEMQQGRLPYGYVYPREETGANVAVYTAPPQQEKQEPVCIGWDTKTDTPIMGYTAPPQQEKQEPVAWKNAAMRLGEELSSVGPAGYYDMTAEQWLDWAMDQQPRGKNSLAAPPQRQPLTEEELDDIWIHRNCIEAIQRGDILAQFRAAGRAIERKHGIGGGE